MQQPKTPPFLMYQRDNARQTIDDLVELATAAYARRFACAPTLLLVPLDTPDPLPAGAERRAGVGVGCVWAGQRL